ncbi:hypothetical protein VE25_18845 [Devosia geojensis]|uniref:Uncharacterized protein n=1 Tax=Devosia geojensis TaxID=443610 RepID=A0A0F5FHT8_9HYPH|nr:metallochaperone AztD [Devosia geojensis]KKB08421.1 hypothetical protein VE25_18845 [Devosia geojensis]
MRLTMLTASAALMLAASTLATSAQDTVSAWRLFVADHGEPVVRAIDLPTGDEIGAFPLASPATLYTTESKAAVYAVQGAGNRVSVISSGLAFEDHGDHGDLEVSDPALLDVTLEDERPVHFVAHDGEVALFFDGSGVVQVVRESALLAGESAPRTFTTDAPHHGVAAPVGAHVLVTRPNADDPKALPVGIDVLDADGEQIGELHECPDLHGEATSGHTLAIACAAGILFVDEGSPEPQIEFVAYTDDLPEGKVTTLLGGVGLKYWLGNYGADRVAIIDPADEVPFRLVDLPSRRVHFAIDPARAGFAYVLTEDGVLNEIDIVAGTISRTLEVTQPYSMDGEWSLPRPRIAVAGSEIAVTDPLNSMIHVVSTESFALDRDIAVQGMPYNIVALGGSGESH